MCENCDKQREEIWAEIRDLLNYNRKMKGPLSEMLASKIDEVIEAGADEDDMRVEVEALRAELIATRCAFIARATPGSEFHGMPPSIVLGAWAGNAMQAEKAAALGAVMGNLFRELFRKDEEN